MFVQASIPAKVVSLCFNNSLEFLALSFSPINSSKCVSLYRPTLHQSHSLMTSAQPCSQWIHHPLHHLCLWVISTSTSARLSTPMLPSFNIIILECYSLTEVIDSPTHAPAQQWDHFTYRACTVAWRTSCTSLGALWILLLLRLTQSHIIMALK